MRPKAEWCDEYATCERCQRLVRGRVVPVDPMAIEGKQKPAPGSISYSCGCGWKRVEAPSEGAKPTP